MIFEILFNTFPLIMSLRIEVRPLNVLFWNQVFVFVQTMSVHLTRRKLYRSKCVDLICTPTISAEVYPNCKACALLRARHSLNCKAEEKWLAITDFNLSIHLNSVQFCQKHNIIIIRNKRMRQLVRNYIQNSCH